MRLASAVALSCGILTLSLGGCGGRVPVTHYYLLEPADVRANPSGLPGLAIGVRTFHVDPPYDQDRIVYRLGPGSTEIGFYAYHRWATPLERMLPRVVAASFLGVPGVRSIEPAVSGRPYDAYLTGRVVAFEEIDTAEEQRVRVELRLTLELEDEILWSEAVTGNDTLSTKEVGAVVERMRSALADALRSARPGLQQTLLER